MSAVYEQSLNPCVCVRFFIHSFPVSCIRTYLELDVCYLLLLFFASSFSWDFPLTENVCVPASLPPISIARKFISAAHQPDMGFLFFFFFWAINMPNRIRSSSCQMTIYRILMKQCRTTSFHHFNLVLY